MKRKPKSFAIVVEQCPDTGLYVGHVPGIRGVHSQGATLGELRKNIVEVLAQESELLLEEQIRLYRRSRVVARRLQTVLDANEDLRRFGAVVFKKKA